MKTAKKAAVNGAFSALLIAAQYVLSGISGVEIVTVLFFCFCYVFGIKNGLVTAVAFSLLRCFLFGFFPNVIILYLSYYCLFAVAVGYLGHRFGERITVVKHIITVTAAAVLTVVFTLIDDIVTPLWYGFSFGAAKMYFYTSFAALIPQTVCAAVTVALLAIPIKKALFSVKRAAGI